MRNEQLFFYPSTMNKIAVIVKLPTTTLNILQEDVKRVRSSTHIVQNNSVTEIIIIITTIALISKKGQRNGISTNTIMNLTWQIFMQISSPLHHQGTVL